MVNLHGVADRCAVEATRGRSGCSENARLNPEANVFDANGDSVPEQATPIGFMSALADVECGKGSGGGHRGLRRRPRLGMEECASSKFLTQWCEMQWWCTFKFIKNDGLTQGFHRLLLKNRWTT